MFNFLQVIVFLDDLNMPALEQYGAQPPLELLRQFMELSGFYDTHKLVWKVGDWNEPTFNFYNFLRCI